MSVQLLQKKTMCNKKNQIVFQMIIKSHVLLKEKQEKK